MSINLLVLRVADIERSRAFYETLDLSFEAEQHSRGPAHYSARAGGSLVLELYPRGDLTTSDVRLGFLVDSVKSVCDAVEALGGTVKRAARETDRGTEAIIVDPDGHTIDLLQSIPYEGVSDEMLCECALGLLAIIEREGTSPDLEVEKRCMLEEIDRRGCEDLFNNLQKQ